MQFVSISWYCYDFSRKMQRTCDTQTIHWFVSVCASKSRRNFTMQLKSMEKYSSKFLYFSIIFFSNVKQKYIFCARIFNLVADINAGVIFWLLPPNVCLMAISLYNMEHVNFTSIFSHFTKWILKSQCFLFHFQNFPGENSQHSMRWSYQCK